MDTKTNAGSGVAPAIPSPPDFWHQQLYRRFPRSGRSLRRRILRRARDLALLERQRYYKAMVAELYLGRVSEEDIELWTPMVGASATLEKLYEAIGEKRKAMP
jgi:hypothetical protein